MRRFGLTLIYCSISFEAVATQNNPPLGIIITSRVFRKKGCTIKKPVCITLQILQTGVHCFIDKIAYLYDPLSSLFFEENSLRRNFLK